ncbi:MAG: hypothetical protein M1816_005100 [Peltula sp. TS41687]|nr:MAG: hypothetical protein M1816_005100 [Peltula sp. TS41687]
MASPSPSPSSSSLPPSPGTPPDSIDPYEVLGVSQSATPEDIKRAYRQAALKHHPDKVAPDQKASAHRTFQTIAFAYSILSSPARKARYDATGSTAELDLGTDEEGFNWADFYRAQFAEISGDAIERFKRGYQGSEREREDLLRFFVKQQGNMDKVFQEVMLSDPLEDEERFRAVIDEAIEKGEVQGYERYVNEPEAKRKNRADNARREGKEAMEYAKELGVAERLFGDGEGGEKRKGRKNGKKGEEGLQSLIQQRMKTRAEGFLDGLEAKYTKIENELKAKRKAKKGRGGGRKRKVDVDAVFDAVVEDDLDEEEEVDGVLEEQKQETEEAEGEPARKPSTRQKRQRTGGGAAGGRQQPGRASKRTKKT